ncbi:probable ATP-dependent RNA helicase DDX4 isoform X1 [Dermochelys coriacea]|uniref:probable ATP-dependent RNA helicase DDX4 isoform X1 n=2 Tax=Dermochelys coriacea TaxID=27794 RepID=UPI0018E76F39|nr:probable ATP-dependent RNA helicase DDX4 isoform X1 [Dermochelys coriacea]XP_038259151.1 probable ATP-dependent RNA helicase DDX4 isoform X1 [Dermochelys coriacea]XP_038259153.1 probable ATP-dependent RNA helicase DDX4 isoform X1 [Dermochelys coriacea]XP_038259154.1 probable ATP-dependent RNA helicase DDX4 isoform X1 [Dermochelys coriacea]XP_038259155.1 probable ATP-dependent RNA helicase DDX4 isoform X1 [Dermochelys coriacea]XP_038259156.1 probable ATP-dependent RNA helicase DDX4 isoform X
MGDEDWDTEIQDRVASFVPDFQQLDNFSGRANDPSFRCNQSINSADAGVRPNRSQPVRGGFGTGRSFGNRASLGNKFEERSSSGFERESTEDGQSRMLSRRGGFQEGSYSENLGTRRGVAGGFRGGRGGFGQSQNNENEQQGQQSGSAFISRRGEFGGPTGDNDSNRNRGFGSKGGYRGYNEEVIAGSGRSSWKLHGETASGDNQGPKVTYVPPPPPDNEEAIFAHYQTGINFDKYDTILVEVSGLDPPPAILTFEEANLCQTLNKNIAKAGYLKLTPVQKYSIPIILAGRDLMACAQTGSGKTAAFLLPILAHMMKDGVTASHFREQQEPECIIVAPTRELINQIFLEARKFSYGTCIRPVVIYGGTQTGHSIRQIMQGCNILCATPGRLMDIIGKEKIGLREVRYLVLDEADRMLDMGFGPEMKKLISCPGMPSKDRRQTLMFSATFPEEIQRLAGEFLKPEYLFVAVGQVGGACSDVQQTILQVSQYSKREKLVEILQSIRDERTMVFVETKKKADFIATFLCQEKIPTTSIHGDREQREREEALGDFRSGKCPVLVATSVAARGLDIENVQHVINFDLPSTIDEYVHRIGRTGRCGNIGKAISFFDSVSDSHIAQPLLKVLSDAQQEVPLWLEEIAFSAHGTGFSNPRGNIFASVDTRKTYQGKDSMNTGGLTMSYTARAADESWD